MHAGGTIDELTLIGNNSLFSCPDCGGVLFKLENDKVNRYRCHPGHTYYTNELLNKQNKSRESTFRVALRTPEERKKLLAQLGERNTKRF